MLIGIPKVISPSLLKVLYEMGHGDRIVIADGNFPAESIGKDIIVIRQDGNGTLDILDAVLKLMPLDTYIEKPVKLMEVVKDDPVATPIWDDYIKTIGIYDKRGKDAIDKLERYAFYDAAKTAYAIIATSESALYANIILQKGVV